MKAMFKKFLSVFLTITLVLGSTAIGLSGIDFENLFSVKAKAASVEDLSYKINDEGTVTITDCDESASGELIIPAEIEGKPVTFIGYIAFWDCTSLTSINIPDSVISIGSIAFWDCTSLTSINIPDSVTSIGDSAFEGCESLTSINIPDGVTSIGDSVFRGCASLTSINIPDSVTSIGGGAFWGCESLTSINIPDGVTSIGDSVFWGCASLTSINIPDSVTSIDDSAFYNTEYYNDENNWENGILYIGHHLIEAKSDIVSGEYTVKAGTKTIADGAFYECELLTSINIPDGITSIGESAFSGCKSLTSINIPDSVTYIGGKAFDSTEYYNDANNWDNGVLYIGNHLIKASPFASDYYTVKDGTKTIADWAFEHCALTSIIFPDSVTSIGYKAFAGCTSLEDVYYAGSESGWKAISISDGNEALFNAIFDFAKLSYTVSWNIDGKIKTQNYDEGDKIEKPADPVKDGFTFKGWKDKNGNIVEIPATMPAKDLTFTAVFEENIYTIIWKNDNGTVTITGCDKSASGELIIPAEIEGKPVTSIGDGAFSDCTALTSVILPDSVTAIEYKAFSGCSSLKNISLPSGIKRIGYFAFVNCSELNNINLPDDIKFIGMSAFFGTGIHNDEKNWDKGVLYVGNHIVAANPEVVSGDYDIKEGTKTIVLRAFEYCGNLTGITMPDSLRDMSWGTFANCEALEKVRISNNVTSIGYTAFDGCSSLTSINIPDSVTSIGDYAFSGCASLTSINIPDSVTSISDFAFDGCTSLKDVYYAGSESGWEAISISVGNEALSNAKIHYAKLSYTVSWNIDGKIKTQNYDEGDKIEKPADPVKDGFTFKGWKDENGNIVEIPATMPAKDLTFTAVFEKIGPSAHVWGEWSVVVAPSCTEKGREKRVCSVCGEEEYRDINALGHQLIKIPAVAPSCTKTGNNAYYKCSRCGKYFKDAAAKTATTPAKEILKALGHSFGSWVTNKAPTCTAKGQEKRVCTRCEKTECRDVAALGHSYRWIVTKKPRAGVEGEKVYKCKNCGNITKREKIPALPPEQNRFLSHDEIYSFSNSPSDFTTGSYTMDDAFFNKLAGYVVAQYGKTKADSWIAKLQEYRNSVWQGSCYGMATTAILDKTVQIGLNENFDPDAANMNEVDSPRDNNKVQSAINYYHISQILKFTRSDSYWDDESSWSAGLKQLVDNAKNGKLMLFCYWFYAGGHAIVITGYEAAKDGGHNLIAYDNRYPDREVIVKIDKKYKTCVVDGSEKACGVEFTDDFSKFDLIDIDGGASSVPSSDMSEKNNTYLTVVADGDVKITNKKGETIEISKDKIGGTMDILSKHIIVNSQPDGSPAPVSFVFEVKDTDELTFETVGGKVDASVVAPDMYASAKADQGRAIVRKDSGIYLEDASGDYKIGLSVNNDIYDMFVLSGRDQSKVSLERDGDDIIASGAKGDNMLLTVYSETTKSEKIAFASEHDKIKIEGSSGTLRVTASSKNDNMYDIDIFANACDVKWYVDGSIVTSMVKVGTEITPPEEPKKAGYVFIGWTDESGNIVEISKIKPEKDMIFIAKWEKQSSESEIALGDIDGDKKIDAADARLALRAAVDLEKLTADQTKAADVDFDKKITAADARKILRAAVGLEKLTDKKAK